MIKKRFANTNVATVIAVAGVGALAVWYTKRQVVETAEFAGDLVDPFSRTNLFNRGANYIGRSLSGNPEYNYGDWLRGVLFDDEDKP